MKFPFLIIIILTTAVLTAFPQKSFDREAAKAAREEMREAKAQAQPSLASPADFSAAGLDESMRRIGGFERVVKHVLAR